MSIRLRKSTPRNLFFEDILLPKWAHAIDVLPNSILRDLNFRTQTWFFRFSVCIGRVRRSPTLAIRRHCEQLLGEIHRRRSFILVNIPIRSRIRETPEVVLAQWTAALNQMIELSAGKKSCSWYADGHPSDCFWPGSLRYVKQLEARGYVFEAAKAEQKRTFTGSRPQRDHE